MDGDEIRVAEKVVLGNVVRARGLGFLFGQVLAPGDSLHAEGLADRGRTLAKLAKAEDAEREAFEVASDRRLPRRAAFQPCILETDSARKLQHQAEGDAGGRAAGRAGPADCHASFGAGFDVE